MPNNVIPDSVKTGIPKLSHDLPHGWQRLKMGDLVEIVERPLVLKADAEYKLVTVRRNRGGVDLRQILRGNKIKTSNQHTIQQGDFLISKRQISHGACAIVPNELNGGIVSSEYLILKVKNNCDLNFLNFYAHSIHFQETCFHSSVGIHVEKLIFKPAWWFKFEHNIPDIKEQVKISQTLELWKKSLSIIDDLISEKLKLKIALMQQLFTEKKRFAEFKKSWNDIKLEDCFIERKESKCIDLPLLSIGANGVYPQSESNKDDTSNSDKSKYKRICAGDIGYNTMRLWQGRSALSHLEGIVSPAYTIVVPKDNVDAVFCSYLFKYPELINRFYRNSQGMVSDTLNCKFKDFAIVKVRIPGKVEQIRIANLLKISDREISLLKDKRDFLRDQKKGMMQQLLTGKKRLILEK